MANDALIRRKAFSNIAATIETPEQLGVTLMTAVHSTASKTKITSEDGQNLLVPIDIRITPENDIHADIQTDCHSECWKVLGHDVFCRKKCVAVETPDGRHKSLSDSALLARVKSGPPLANADDFDAVLSKGAITAGSASEAGIILSNAIARMLADGSAPINEDGTAHIECLASISVAKTLLKRCTSTTYQILGFDVVSYETCETMESNP